MSYNPYDVIDHMSCSTVFGVYIHPRLGSETISMHGFTSLTASASMHTKLHHLVIISDAFTLLQQNCTFRFSMVSCDTPTFTPLGSANWNKDVFLVSGHFNNARTLFVGFKYHHGIVSAVSNNFKQPSN